jgi:hypothetical protein
MKNDEKWWLASGFAAPCFKANPHWVLSRAVLQPHGQRQHGRQPTGRTDCNHTPFLQMSVATHHSQSRMFCSMTAVQKNLCEGSLGPRNLGVLLWQREAAPSFKVQRHNVRAPKTLGFPNPPHRIIWEVAQVAYPVFIPHSLGPPGIWVIRCMLPGWGLNSLACPSKLRPSY